MQKPQRHEMTRVLGDGQSATRASWARRLTARLVDLTITAAIAFIADTTFRVLTLTLYGDENYDEAYSYGAASLFVAVLLFEVSLIVNTARKGTTPGKKLLGIKVIAHSDSLPPGTTRAIIRWAFPLAPTAPLIDGFIRDIPELANNEHAAALSGRAWWIWAAVGWWLLAHVPALWDRDRRGWHEKASDTIVIRAAPLSRADQ